MTLTIRVYGLPAPQGSKRHVGNGVMVESSAKVKPWREAVKWAALEAVADNRGVDFAFAPLEGPLSVGVTFYLPRPRGHFRTGKNAHLIRESAPILPAKKPDLDKLLRSTLDALGEAGVWRDDAQVAYVAAAKEYDDRRASGADITVRLA